jgi:hypothetical protein
MHKNHEMDINKKILTSDSIDYLETVLEDFSMLNWNYVLWTKRLKIYTKQINKLLNTHSKAIVKQMFSFPCCLKFCRYTLNLLDYENVSRLSLKREQILKVSFFDDWKYTSEEYQNV